MRNNGYKAYKEVERTTSSARQTEARVLTEGALRLERCRDNWTTTGEPEGLQEALYYNQRVWTVLQAALASHDCPLPEDVRKNMMKLSWYIDLQIFKAMAAPSPDVLAAIIDINLGIAKGLQTTPPPHIRSRIADE